MSFRVPRTNGRFGGRSREFTILTPAACAIAAAAVALAAATPAEAQIFFDYGYGRPAVVKKPKVKRSRPVEATYDHSGIERGNKTKETVAERKPEGPLVITVSLRRQRVSVWDQSGLMMEAPISSGKLGTPTPTGVYSILQKNRVHYSNLYDSAPMPNMQRITWSGVALHAGQLPGYPASHGCIRLPHGFSKRLFEVTKMGTRVIVAYDPVQPVSFTHPRLFAAYPEDRAAMHALIPGGTQVADASETQSRGAPTEVGSVLGVSTAYAATNPGVNSEIEALREKRRSEMERLAADVVSARAEKESAVAAAKARVDDMPQLKTALRDRRVELQKLADEARKADRDAKDAQQKLAKLYKGLAGKTDLTPERVAKATTEEEALEAAILDQQDRAEAARAQKVKAEEAVAAAEKAVADADKARVDAVKRVHEADAKLTAALDSEAAAKRREAKRKEPVHVFISRKTQKIYVRQGYEPILEAPVSIERPDEPVGTHVFTALAVDPAKADVSWSVASIPTITRAKTDGSNKDRAAARIEAERVAGEMRKTQTADAALQRVNMPADVRLTIEDAMKPGSSLIISDNGLSNETGKFTDFIVPVR